MRRREFNRIALGAALSPLVAKPTLAQWYEGPSPPTQEPPKKVRHRHQTFSTHIQSGKSSTEVRRGAPVYDLLDVELSVGGKPRRQLNWTTAFRR